MNILSIIPARSGSNGLPKKNTIDLAGAPLIAWSIEASKQSTFITRSIVSSDNEEILAIASQYGADVLLRPVALSSDNTPTEPVITHVLDNIEQVDQYSYIVLLQPTSPLRNGKDIDNAMQYLLTQKATALISVKEVDNKILKAFTADNRGYLKGISNNNYPFMSRHDLPNVYMPNGAIYVIHVHEFLATKKLFTNRTIPYVMSEQKSIDIDNANDLRLARQIIKNLNGN
ncbi:MAG: cytidylyltransferase domain-containing protein [Salinispira sp.]